MYNQSGSFQNKILDMVTVTRSMRLFEGIITAGRLRKGPSLLTAKAGKENN
jgi:hypothetical protein